MFAQLGEYIFEGLKSPASLTDNRAVKFGRVSLVNGKDAIQFTGEELSTLALSIVYSIDFCDPSVEIEALRKSMTTAEALPFIMGDGSVVGKYVITTVDVTAQAYSAVGTLQSASVAINLLEYAAGEAPEPKGMAVAGQNSTPPSQPAAPPVEKPASKVATLIAKANGAINKAKAAVQKAKDKPSKLKSAIREVKKCAAIAKEAYDEAKGAVEETQKVIDRTKDLVEDIETAVECAVNLAKTSDWSELESNINKMNTASDNATASAAPVMAFVATKEGGK